MRIILWELAAGEILLDLLVKGQVLEERTLRRSS
jgi:hypothetical protein